MQTYYAPKSVGSAMRRTRTRGVLVMSLAEQIEAKISSVARAEAEVEKTERMGNEPLIQSAKHILTKMQEGLATLRRMQAEQEAAEETKMGELLDSPHFDEPARQMEVVQ